MSTFFVVIYFTVNEQIMLFASTSAHRLTGRLLNITGTVSPKGSENPHVKSSQFDTTFSQFGVANMEIDVKIE
jgi:hypothetical protein